MKINIWISFLLLTVAIAITWRTTATIKQQEVDNLEKKINELKTDRERSSQSSEQDKEATAILGAQCAMIDILVEMAAMRDANSGNRKSVTQELTKNVTHLAIRLVGLIEEVGPEKREKNFNPKNFDLILQFLNEFSDSDRNAEAIHAIRSYLSK